MMLTIIQTVCHYLVWVLVGEKVEDTVTTITRVVIVGRTYSNGFVGVSNLLVSFEVSSSSSFLTFVSVLPLSNFNNSS